uniref:glucosamine-6-phosphate deaminase n=1 Tax=Pararhizobium sp. IMCC3301 TaxID=3067904 RepID=UPI00274066E0|nr:glucosamine-6-phosphate deaminase [Pararhizobium sp. IMCC3301]
MFASLAENSSELGQQAAHAGAAKITEAIKERGEAFVILATGASQLETLDALIAAPDIDWSRVTIFHLDEYIGMPDTHKASFRGYLKTRFINKVGALKAFVPVNGDASDLEAELARISKVISEVVIDVAFIGIGENGHLAFNDPPADFDTTQPYIVVQLDEKCRRQQSNEGWFADFSEVPTEAISMSVREILRSRTLVCAVPDARKAEAVKNALEGPVSNSCPASIIRTHDNTYLFLDPESAALLSPGTLAALASET